MLVLWVVVAAVQAQAPGDAIDIAHAARVADSLPALERAWSERLAADPGDAFPALGLGFLDYVSYRYDAAAARFTTLVATTSQDAIAAHAAYGLGLVERARADFPAADSALQRSVDLARATADSSLVVLALTARAAVGSRLEGAAAARAHLDEAARWTRPDTREHTVYVCNRAALDPSIGTADLEAAASSAAADGDPHVEAICLFQAVARSSQRAMTDSVYMYGNRAIDRFAAAHDDHGLASALQFLGFYDRSVGAYAVAEARLERAVTVGRRSGNESAVAWALLNLAALSRALGDVVAGLEQAREATEMLERHGDLVGLASVRSFEGALWRDAGVYDRALEAYRSALRASRDLGQPSLVLPTHSDLGYLALEIGDLDEAREQFVTYRDLVHEYGFGALAPNATHQLADVALAGGAVRTADSLYASIQGLERQPTRSASLLAKMAAARARMADIDSAYALATRSAGVLEEWRRVTSDQRLRLYAFQREGGDDGMATTVAALAGVGRLDDAHELSERRRARELLDQLTRENTLADRPITERAREVVSLSELQAGLDSTTAVLAYTTGGGEPTTILFTRRDGTRAYPAPPVDSLAPSVRRLVSLLEAGSGHQAPAAELSAALLPMGPGELDGITRLVIVAEDVIQRVPFDVLQVSDGAPLVERAAIGFVPSATVARRVATEPLPPLTGTLLAIGDPTWPDTLTHPAFDASGGLPRLRGSGREARRVGRFGTRAEVRLRGEASESFLRSADLGSYDVIHLATHAVVSEQGARRTVVALSPGDGEDGFVSAPDLASLTLGARLIVLSACRSGGGEMVRGEGIQGLTAPLLRAGARSVVATAWRVDDDAVTPFVDRLYRGLAEGLSASEALARAKRAGRSAGEPASVWAAFFLVGDGTVAIPLRPPSPVRSWWALAVAALASLALLGWLRRRVSGA